MAVFTCNACGAAREGRCRPQTCPGCGAKGTMRKT
ncbi:MAG: rubredoxin [Nitrospirae bacterium]|nr:rubredoxin [Nitrospirota bacterium]